MLFTIKNRVIKCVSDDIRSLIGDNSDYKAHFIFDDEWNTVTKTARFIQGGKYSEQIIQNNECIIPSNVLKRGNLTVGVYTPTMVTTPCEIYIRESIKQENGSTAPPTDDVYSQIISLLDEIKQQSLTKEEVEAIVQEYVNTHKEELKGEPGYTPQRGVDYWTSSDISAITAYIDTQIGGALNGSY